MTNEKIILQLEKGYDIKNPQLAQVLTNIENNGVTKGEFTEAMGTKADLVGGKVPAEQLPSYVDDVIEFYSSINGYNPIDFYINNKEYTDKVFYIISNSTSAGNINEKYNKKFIDFGANTSEDDWTIIESEEGKIYIKIGSGNDKNHSFRWSGSDLIDLDKKLYDQIVVLGTKTVTVYLGDIKDPLDLSKFQDTSILSTLYIYLNQRDKSTLVNLSWRYNSVNYSSPIIDADPVERSFRIYNQGYLQTYKVLKESSNYSLVKVNDIPEFVSLDYSQIGVVLSDDLIERLKNAAGVIINDDQAYPNARNVYISSMKSDNYLFFTTTKNVSVSETSITFEILLVNLKTNQLTLNIRRFTLPYGAYSQFGFTGKSSDAVNQEVARLVNMNSCYITPSDLNKVHSGDKLENIKNATFLILDEGNGKTKIFIRGSASTFIIYSCIDTTELIKYILLDLNSNKLSPIGIAYFDDIMFINYRRKGGTRTNKYLMYEELAAQLTENTYVLDSSKLNTVLTDAEASSVQNATTLIISNSNTNNLLVFKRGHINNKEIYFMNNNLVSGGSLSINRIIYNITTKTCSNITLSTVDPYIWYIGNGGNKSNKNDFININKFLYNNTYIIDKTLLNTTISDTSIQDSIKRANILVIEDSTDSSYTVYIRGFVTSNAIYFFNMQNTNSSNITVTRASFNTTTNLLSSNDVYLQSAFNAYKLGGGTKYGTEVAFNKAFAAAIDAYTPTI